MKVRCKRAGTTAMDNLARYISRHALPPPSCDEEVLLLARVRGDDEKAKMELLLRFGKLVLKRVGRYSAFAKAIGVDFDDLLMDAINVLFYSAKHFDPSKSRFSTYLTIALDHEIRRKMYQYPLLGFITTEYNNAKYLVTSLNNEDDPVTFMHHDDDAERFLLDAEDRLLVEQILDAATVIDDPSIPILIAYSIGGQHMSKIMKDYMLTPKRVASAIRQAAALIRYQIGMISR